MKLYINSIEVPGDFDMIAPGDEMTIIVKAVIDSTAYYTDPESNHALARAAEIVVVGEVEPFQNLTETEKAETAPHLAAVPDVKLEVEEVTEAPYTGPSPQAQAAKEKVEKLQNVPKPTVPKADEGPEIATCALEGCTNTFEQPATGRKRKFCSDTHRVQARRNARAPEVKEADDARRAELHAEKAAEKKVEKADEKVEAEIEQEAAEKAPLEEPLPGPDPEAEPDRDGKASAAQRATLARYVAEYPALVRPWVTWCFDTNTPRTISTMSYAQAESAIEWFDSKIGEVDEEPF